MKTAILMTTVFYVVAYMMFFRRPLVAMFRARSRNPNWYGKLLEDDDFNVQCGVGGAICFLFATFVVVRVIVPGLL